jgi:glutathione S-transferase
LAVIYHIATAADWERAVESGEYTTSTRGRTLAEEGFLHASDADQLAPVANTFYKGISEPLLLLVIDTGKLTSPLRYDDVPGAAKPFPHIYGPLNTDAVTAAIPLEPGPDGNFTFAP